MRNFDFYRAATRIAFASIAALGIAAAYGAEPSAPNADAGDNAVPRLAESYVSAYTIVLPDEPSVVQQTAASELQTYVERISGARLPIASESEAPAERLLVIGPSALSQKLLGDLDESTIEQDGIVVKTIGENVVLTGSPERGPIYAAYEFLEALGVRWLTSAEEYVPRDPNAALPRLDVNYAPRLKYRESFYRDAFSSPFAVRLRCNGDTCHIPAEFGGKNNFLFGCHSSFTLIPPKVYFKEHNDWFAEIDGVRRVGAPFCWGMEDQMEPGQGWERGTQLCFSNEEMLEELIENAKKELRAHPETTFIDISQNDCEGYCQCEKCRAIDEEEGSHAGTLLRAVNKVAEALEDEFPNVYVETLAYTYTRKPPKLTKPRKNVVIRLCSIECSFGEPLDSEINAEFCGDLRGWAAICDNLFIWDYATDFAYYLLPFPNYHVLAPNIRFYVQNHAIGLLEQGDYQMPFGDFVELRAWIVAKLLWNPDADHDALFDEFVSLYYAPELVPIYREYFDLLSQAVLRDNFWLGIYWMTTQGWLDVETLTKCTRLQNEAAAIAKRLAQESPERYSGLVEKVRRGRLPLDAVWAQEYRRAYVETRLRGLDFLGPADPVQAAKEFLQNLDDWGFVKRRENEPGDMYPNFRKETLEEYAGWRTPFSKKSEKLAGAPDDAWIELQEFELVREENGPEIVDNANASNGYETAIADGQTARWVLPEQIELLREREGVFQIYVELEADENVELTARVGERETKIGGGALAVDKLELEEGTPIEISAKNGPARVDRILIVKR